MKYQTFIVQSVELTESTCSSRSFSFTKGLGKPKIKPFYQYMVTADDGKKFRWFASTKQSFPIGWKMYIETDGQTNDINRICQIFKKNEWLEAVRKLRIYEVNLIEHTKAIIEDIDKAIAIA
jgi:hypothetical protein